MNVFGRYEALRQTRSHLKLFALVDGLGYEQLEGVRLQTGPGRCLGWLMPQKMKSFGHVSLPPKRTRRACRGCSRKCPCTALLSCCS